MKDEKELREIFDGLRVGREVTVKRLYSFRTGKITRVREFPYFYVEGRATTVYCLAECLESNAPGERKMKKETLRMILMLAAYTLALFTFGPIIVALCR